jgi:hypothetical protein
MPIGDTPDYNDCNSKCACYSGINAGTPFECERPCYESGPNAGLFDQSTCTCQPKLYPFGLRWKVASGSNTQTNCGLGSPDADGYCVEQNGYYNGNGDLVQIQIGWYSNVPAIIGTTSCEGGGCQWQKALSGSREVPCGGGSTVIWLYQVCTFLNGQFSQCQDSFFGQNKGVITTCGTFCAEGCGAWSANISYQAKNAQNQWYEI